MPENVIILSESSGFPWGMAANTRVRNIAKALLAEQFSVEYVGLRGASVSDVSIKSSKGYHENIKYDYPGGFAVRSNKWCMRRIDDFFGFLFSAIKFFRLKIMGKLNIVIIYSSRYIVITFWTRFFHLFNVPVVLEICEWPFTNTQAKNRGFKHSKLFFYRALLNVDAVFTISTYIENKVKAIAHKYGKHMLSYRLPILIDVKPSKPKMVIIRQNQYLLYSGSIAYLDIAIIVVDIIYQLKRHGFDLNIKFTGVGPKKYFDQLKRYAAEKEVLNNFVFTGFIDDKELYLLMQKALALLAPLPMNSKSKSRFPTKIGYYLASGTPVVTNLIGDVGVYLKDGVNAIVATECNVLQFAEKIEMIINEPDLAKSIGFAGRELALEKFHFTTACRGLGNYMRNVVENYKR